MTLSQRAEAYAAAFPKYPSMWVNREWLMGVWVLGNYYKRPTRYYGAFPGNFCKRVLSLFPDRQRTLHLFSGTLPAGLGEVTLDCLSSAEVRPSVVASAQQMPFAPATFDFVLADPPYSAKDAKQYGTPMIIRAAVMREVGRVVRTGGHLCWLDTVWPMYRADTWKQVGAIAVLVSTNTRVRCLSVFERVAA